jgi:hypothetical protein
LAVMGFRIIHSRVFARTTHNARMNWIFWQFRDISIRVFPWQGKQGILLVDFLGPKNRIFQPFKLAITYIFKSRFANQ